MFNALSARGGGGILVCRCLLSRLELYPPNWRFVVLVSNERAERELSSVVGNTIQVKKIPKALSRVAVFLQSQVVSLAARRIGASVVVSQNIFLPGVGTPQIVVHVNVFNFLPNPSLSGWSENLQQRLRQRLSLMALKKASVNMFESRHLIDLAIERSGSEPNSPVLIYLGVDESKLASSAPAPSEVAPVLTVITSDSPHKRNEMIVEVLARLVASAPNVDWRCEVYGGVADGGWPEMRRLATELKVDNRIRFNGYLGPDRLQAGIDESLCVISASEQESFCSVALEGMARGKPAVVAARAAMPESVAGAGVAIDDDIGVAGYVEEILRLQSDENYYHERAVSSLDRARQLTWTAAVNDFSEALRVVMQEPKHA